MAATASRETAHARAVALHRGPLLLAIVPAHPPRGKWLRCGLDGRHSGDSPPDHRWPSGGIWSPGACRVIYDSYSASRRSRAICTSTGLLVSTLADELRPLVGTHPAARCGRGDCERAWRDGRCWASCTQSVSLTEVKDDPAELPEADPVARACKPVHGMSRRGRAVDRDAKLPDLRARAASLEGALRHLRSAAGPA